MKTLEHRFREWVEKTPGINFGHLDHMLKYPESVASYAFLAYRAGWRAAKKDQSRPGKTSARKRTLPCTVCGKPIPIKIPGTEWAVHTACAVSGNPSMGDV